MKRLGYGALLAFAAVALPVTRASAQLNFTNTPFTLSNTVGYNDCCTQDGTTQVNNQVTLIGTTLNLINNVYGTAASGFTTSAQNLTQFTPWSTSFDFSLTPGQFDPQADGFAFVLQSNNNNNQGFGGGEIGYGGMGASAAFGFRSWDNNDYLTGVNGTWTSLGTHNDWGNVQLGAITGSVSLFYDGAGTITYGITSNQGDAISGSTAFDESGLTAGNVFLGFVAGTGLSTANQEIMNWSFSARQSSVTPEPATMTLLASGLVGMAGLRRRRRRKN